MRQIWMDAAHAICGYRTDTRKSGTRETAVDRPPRPVEEVMPPERLLPHCALPVGREHDGADEAVRLLTERALGVRGVAEQGAEPHVMVFLPGWR